MVNEIEVLRNSEDSSIEEVMFRWGAMIICMAQTLGLDGRRYFSVKTVNALDAVHITDQTTATFITSREDEEYSAAHAHTISRGLVPNATEKNTEGK